MTSHTAKHSSTGIMNITTDQLLAKQRFIFRRGYITYREAISRFKAGIFQIELVVKSFAYILVQRHGGDLFDNFAEEDIIVIAVNVFAGGPEFALQNSFVHGVYPVVPQEYVFG